MVATNSRCLVSRSDNIIISICTASEMHPMCCNSTSRNLYRPQFIRGLTIINWKALVIRSDYMCQVSSRQQIFVFFIRSKRNILHYILYSCEVFRIYFYLLYIIYIKTQILANCLQGWESSKEQIGKCFLHECRENIAHSLFLKC